MITLDQARTLQGKTLYGPGHEKLGTIDTLYADRDGGEPTFATVHTGLFGTKTHFVPLAQAELMDDHVMVPYAKDQVNAAPNIDTDAELSPEEEEQLYSHYGLAGGTGATGTTGTGTGDMRNVDEDALRGGTTTGTATAGTTAGMTDRDRDGVPDRLEGRTNEHGTVGHDTSGPTTDDAMTRSEEHLQVGTQRVETGRARLRKFITTETQTETVPVSHEEVRIEREPITDANAGKAYDGPALSEEEHEVTLTAEKPMVNKETVPVERVRLDTETVTEQATVNEEVRKEQIEADGVYPEGTRASDQSRTDQNL
ncbi:MAG: PRC and DUF2382 domain-containing protein [Actinomycetota bacterium]|nr:PRC and DUF2382 domain-containing protein [Actinomycetota bacterium]